MSASLCAPVVSFHLEWLMSVGKTNQVTMPIPESVRKRAEKLSVALCRGVEVCQFDARWRLGDPEAGRWTVNPDGVLSHGTPSNGQARLTWPWETADWDLDEFSCNLIAWFDRDDSTGWLAAYLGNHHDDQWVGLAIADAGEEALAKSAATATLQAQQHLRDVEQLKQQLSELREENNSLAQQISEDFEELILLRAISEHLEICDIDRDIAKMGRVLLPRLCRSVKAVSIALVPASGSEHTICFEELPVWSGDRAMSDDACWRLIESFLPEVSSKPIVRNGRSALPSDTGFDDLHNVLIVPLARAQQVFGFLIAANHIYVKTKSGFRAEWQLSQNEFGTEEATLLSSVAAFMAAHASNVGLFAEKEQLLTNIIRALVTAIDAKDKYTRGHSERVALYGRALARRAGYDEMSCQRMYLTGLLHDVGKIGISDGVLKKPGRLTTEEFDEIKRHPDEGWSILSDLHQLAYVLPGVLFHHERFDGDGYPDGLHGNAIPMDGRILAVVDAYDAMTSDRPYRRGMAHEKAVAVLHRGSGSQWDPDLIAKFFEIMPEILKIKANYRPTPKRRRIKGRVGGEPTSPIAQLAPGCQQALPNWHGPRS